MGVDRENQLRSKGWLIHGNFFLWIPNITAGEYDIP